MSNENNKENFEHIRIKVSDLKTLKYSDFKMIKEFSRDELIKIIQIMNINIEVFTEAIMID